MLVLLGLSCVTRKANAAEADRSALQDGTEGLASRTSDELFPQE